MVNVQHGDVVRCNLNPQMGTEQAGIRPVLIVQIDRANAVSPHTIMVPFTTKIRRVLLRSHVFIPAGIGGLDQDSVALCEQVRVIDKQRVISSLGVLDQQYMQEVDTALRVILGL